MFGFSSMLGSMLRSRPGSTRNFALAAATLTLVPLAARADVAKPPGNVIVARTSGDALLIWDASTDIAGIVTSKTSDADANALLERDAARVLAASLSKVDKSATSITVRVIYQKTGAVSPVYGTATFAGVERYATLKLSAKDANDDRDKWRELGDTSPAPGWFAFAVIGQLPQR
jgi:hypothetical protein